MRLFLLVILFLSVLASCGPNREVSIDQGPGVREIHDDIELHFDEVTVNGVEYLILEKDRNNPDEGFGFMALKGNLIVNHTDSAIAYLRTVIEVQAKIIARLDTISERQAMQQINGILEQNLNKTSIKDKPDALIGRKKSVN